MNSNNLIHQKFNNFSLQNDSNKVQPCALFAFNLTQTNLTKV